MAQRQPMWLQLFLEVRTEGAALDQCTARCAVHLEHAVQVPKIDADCSDVRVADVRLDPAHNRRAAAERDRGGTLLSAPGKHVFDVVLIARIGDDVRRVVVVAADASDQVRVGFAQRVDRALALVLRADRLRDRGGSNLGSGMLSEARAGGDATGCPRRQPGLHPRPISASSGSESPRPVAPPQNCGCAGFRKRHRCSLATFPSDAEYAGTSGSCGSVNHARVDLLGRVLRAARLSPAGIRQPRGYTGSR